MDAVGLGVAGVRVFGAGVFGAGVFGAGVFGAGVFGAGVFGAGVFGAGMFGVGVGFVSFTQLPGSPTSPFRHWQPGYTPIESGGQYMLQQFGHTPGLSAGH